MTTRSSGAVMRSPPGAPARGRASDWLRDELPHGLRRAGAFRDPGLRFLAVEVEARRILRRVVMAELLDDLRGGRAAPVRDDDAIGRGVRAADAAQANLEHDVSFRS